MRSRGYEKPILVGECNGPLLIQHPEALAALAEVWQSGATEPWHRMSVEQFREGKLSATPARNAMKRLYQRMDELFFLLRDGFLLLEGLSSMGRLLLLEILEFRAGGWTLSDTAQKYYYSEVSD